MEKRAANQHENIRSRVLHAAAKLFLEKGYSSTTTREIAQASQVNVSAMNRAFGSKDNILAELVEYVLEGQFRLAAELLRGKTEDRLLFYAAETVLQLHMAESSEHIRDLYIAAYSLPNTSRIIQRTITGKLEEIFREQLPHLQTKDFYELEIASGGIMRGFITIPCDMYFTMDRKVCRFLETTFKLYDVSAEKIRQAVAFVQGFDYPALAKQAVHSLLAYLEEQTV
ncbi:MAG: TetR/AcrR family transcriptional regulator [Oscillospiraceae bacterium]|nr:TetR/AcrR family transcriptional regulator [Oscillospiraceae bacterium]